MSTETGGIPDARRRECEEAFPGCRPGRVSGEGTHIYRVSTDEGEVSAQVTGSFRHRADGKSDYPAVGDYVALTVEGPAIAGLLSRRSSISRKSAGRRTEEQVLAANVDLGIVVAALDGGRNFTSRGVERYITTVWESGARPVLVLNKLDACADPAGFIVAAEESAPGVPILLTSALTGDGLGALREAIAPGETAVLIGPSGVGKSSLINALLGETRLDTGMQREHDRRGRHTSTARHLVMLENGGALIDTPGLRELQLWAGEESLGRTFSDLDAFADACRFRDCTHQGEPGCAVQAAVASGELRPERYESYLELQKELAYLHRRSDEKAMKDEVNRWKQLQKSLKEHHKYGGPHGRS
jgi:ribosome biogenesis GTPase / thiamine phosphate phosphatase